MNQRGFDTLQNSSNFQFGIFCELPDFQKKKVIGIINLRPTINQQITVLINEKFFLIFIRNSRDFSAKFSSTWINFPMLSKSFACVNVNLLKIFELQFKEIKNLSNLSRQFSWSFNAWIGILKSLMHEEL